MADASQVDAEMNHEGMSSVPAAAAIREFTNKVRALSRGSAADRARFAEDCLGDPNASSHVSASLALIKKFMSDGTLESIQILVASMQSRPNSDRLNSLLAALKLLVTSHLNSTALCAVYAYVLTVHLDVLNEGVPPQLTGSVEFNTDEYRAELRFEVAHGADVGPLTSQIPPVSSRPSTSLGAVLQVGSSNPSFTLNAYAGQQVQPGNSATSVDGFGCFAAAGGSSSIASSNVVPRSPAAIARFVSPPRTPVSRTRAMDESDGSPCSSVGESSSSHSGSYSRGLHAASSSSVQELGEAFENLPKPTADWNGKVRNCTPRARNYREL